MPRFVQPRDYLPPVRSVSKGTVHKNNVGLVRHDATSSDESRVAQRQQSRHRVLAKLALTPGAIRDLVGEVPGPRNVVIATPDGDRRGCSK
jgi:hypothetical protein